MAAESHLDGTQRDEAEVMAAIDEVDGVECLVVADVARDDAWLSTPAGCGAPLSEWR